MVLGGGTLKSYLGDEGGAFVSEISLLIKENPECSLLLSAVLEYNEK